MLLNLVDGSSESLIPSTFRFRLQSPEQGGFGVSRCCNRAECHMRNGNRCARIRDLFLGEKADFEDDQPF